MNEVNSGKHAVSPPRHLVRTQLRREALPCRAPSICPNCTAGLHNWHDSSQIPPNQPVCGNSAALPVAPAAPPRTATGLRPHALPPQPSGGGLPHSGVCSPWKNASDNLGPFHPPVPINPPRYTHLARTSTPERCPITRSAHANSQGSVRVT